jgi:hypothetical protein
LVSYSGTTAATEFTALAAGRPAYILVDWQKSQTLWWQHGSWDPATGTSQPPGPWLNDTVFAQLLTQPTVPGFQLVYANDSARVWRIANGS